MEEATETQPPPAAIPTELFWALAREQPNSNNNNNHKEPRTSSDHPHDHLHSPPTQPLVLKQNLPSRIPIPIPIPSSQIMDKSNPTRETIWNKIGFNSSNSHLAILPTLTKKPSTKPSPHQLRQRRQKPGSNIQHHPQTPHKNQQSSSSDLFPPPTLPISQSTKTTPKNSTEQHNRSTTNNSTDHPSAPWPSSHKTRSKFIAADIVTSLFSSKTAHNNTSNSNQEPSPKPSWHLNSSKTAIHASSSSLFTPPLPSHTLDSHPSILPFPEKFISTRSLLLRPPSPSDSLINHVTPTGSDTSSSTDHHHNHHHHHHHHRHHHRYRSASTSLAPADLELVDHAPPHSSPSSNRENFTHQLKAGRPRDRSLLADDPHNTPSIDRTLHPERARRTSLSVPTPHPQLSSQNHSSSQTLVHSSVHSSSLASLSILNSPAPPSQSTSTLPLRPSHPRSHGSIPTQLESDRKAPQAHAPLKPLDVKRANHHSSNSFSRLDRQDSNCRTITSRPHQSPAQVPNTAPLHHSVVYTPQSSDFSPSSPPFTTHPPHQTHCRPPNRTVSRNRSMSYPSVRQASNFYSTRHLPDRSDAFGQVLSSHHGPEKISKPIQRPPLHHLARASLQHHSTRATGASVFSSPHTPEDILKLFEPRNLDHQPSSVRLPEEEDRHEVVCIIDTPEAKAALNVKADFVIGVAGPKGVGKSTIIDKALRKPPSSSHNSVTLYEDIAKNKITSTVSNIQSGTPGNSKTLQILEIDQQILTENFIIIKKDNKSNNAKEGLLSWPERLPHLDGVLLCYDAMDPKALDYLRPLLHSFWTRGGICLIVLACKSNKDEKSNATSPLKAAELVNVYGTGMIQLDGGLDDPSKKMRNSFNWIMKAIKEARGEHRSYSSASTCVLESLCSEENRTGPIPSSTVARSSNNINVPEKLEGPRPVFKGLRSNVSPDRTPRKSSIVPQNAPRDTPASSQLYTHHVETSPNLVDDADGDSFSNNALVAMSYEKSTRPDGSFKDDEQSSSPSSTTEPEEPIMPTSPIKAYHHKSTTALSLDDQKSSSFTTTSPSINEIKSLSTSGKHAAQKALIMSQRGSDSELHLEKHVIINKFVFAIVSGNDPNFVDHFIIIYRRFATPFDVLSALLARFEFVSGHLESDPLLGRYAQLKICHLLTNWLDTYPGDFVQTPTLTVLKAFNTLILSVTWLINYAVEIVPMIKSYGTMTDEDAGWALPDCTDNSAVDKVLETLKTLQVTLAPHSARARELKNHEPVEGQGLPSTPHTTGKSMDGGSSSIPYPISEASPHLDTFSSTFMSTDQIASTAASSPGIAMNPYTSFNDRHNHKLSVDQHSSIEPVTSSDSVEIFSVGPTPLRPIVTSSSHQSDQKGEYKALLESSNQLICLSEDSIALQITRLEWGIFSQMKPRHLIRYVLAPRDPNNPRKALRDPNSPIAQSTEYLNYLAVWASSIILIQDKLKSRAKILLKLMKVAYELRDMDDFHSLMGVLAGIEAQPVYRLDATFDLVKHMDLQAYRRYLSLKKLMSSQRSFSAYRLARQTASSQCVPYLGTYLQDITAVNEVKDDMKDGKVNLSKFLQIAKSAASVINCNLLAPKVFFDKKVSNLIIKIPILSEDIQYGLSYKYKPRVLNPNSGFNNTGVNSRMGGSGPSGSGSFIRQTNQASIIVGGASTSMDATNSLQAATAPMMQNQSPNSTSTMFKSNSGSPYISTATNNPANDNVSSSVINIHHHHQGPSSSTQLVNHVSTNASSSTGFISSLHSASSASQVAKKGTRKLKQLLNTAIHH